MADSDNTIIYAFEKESSYMDNVTLVNLRNKLYKNILICMKDCTFNPSAENKYLYFLLCSLLCKNMRIEFYNILFFSINGNSVDSYSFLKETTIRAIIDRHSKDGIFRSETSGTYKVYSITIKGKEYLKAWLVKYLTNTTLSANDIDNLYKTIDKVPAGQHGAMEMAMICKLLMLCHDPEYLFPLMREGEFGKSGARGATGRVSYGDRNLKADVGFEFGYPQTPVYLEADRFTEPIARLTGSNSKSLTGTISKYINLNYTRSEYGRKDCVIIFVGDRDISSTEVKKAAENIKGKDIDQKYIDIIGSSPAGTYETIIYLLALSFTKDNMLDTVKLSDVYCKANALKELSGNPLWKSEGLQRTIEVMSHLQSRYNGKDEICIGELERFIREYKAEALKTHKATALDILRNDCDKRLMDIYKAMGNSAELSQHTGAFRKSICLSYISYYEMEERLKCLLPEGFFREGVRRFLKRLLGKSEAQIMAYTSGRLVLEDTAGSPELYLRNCYLVDDTVVAIEDLRSDTCSHDRFCNFLRAYGFEKKVIFVGIVSDDHTTFAGKIGESFLYNNRFGRPVLDRMDKPFCERFADTYSGYIKSNELLAYNGGFDYCFVRLSDYLGLTEGDLSPFTELDDGTLVKRQMSGILRYSEPRMVCDIASVLQYVSTTDNDIVSGRNLKW